MPAARRLFPSEILKTPDRQSTILYSPPPLPLRRILPRPPLTPVPFVDDLPPPLAPIETFPPFIALLDDPPALEPIPLQPEKSDKQVIWAIDQILKRVTCDSCGLDVSRVRWSDSILTLAFFMKNFRNKEIRKGLYVWKNFYMIGNDLVRVVWNEDYIPTLDVVTSVKFKAARLQFPSHHLFKDTSQPHSCCGPRRLVNVVYPMK